MLCAEQSLFILNIPMQIFCGKNTHICFFFNAGDDDYVVFTSGSDDDSYIMISPTMSPGTYNLSFWYIVPARAGHLSINITAHGKGIQVYTSPGQPSKQWIQSSVCFTQKTEFQVD